MPITETKGRIITVLLVLAVAVPLALISAFSTDASLLHHSGAPPHSAFPAFALAIAAGVWPVLKLPFRLRYRLLCLLAYVPLAYAALFFTH